MQKTPQKLIDLFEATKDDDGRLPLSLNEFEVLVFKYGPTMLENEASKTSQEKSWVFWLILGTVFFVGLLLGWKWAISSVCSGSSNSLPICATHFGE